MNGPCYWCRCTGCPECEPPATRARARCGCAAYLGPAADPITDLLRTTHAGLPAHCPAKARTKVTSRPVWCAREEHPHSEPHRVQVGLFNDQTIRWYGDNPCGAAVHVDGAWHHCRYLHAAGDNAHEADGYLWTDPAPDWWDNHPPPRYASAHTIQVAAERVALRLRARTVSESEPIPEQSSDTIRMAGLMLGAPLALWQADALRRAFRDAGAAIAGAVRDVGQQQQGG